jgi:hypothetical protein
MDTAILTVLLLVDTAAFWVVYRGLGSPKSGLPLAGRIALGTIVTFGVLAANLWIACRSATLLVVAMAAAIGSLGLGGEGLVRMERALGRHRFPLYLLSVATTAVLAFLFVPVTTFLTSPGEIGVHLDYLLEVNARDAMAVVYLAALTYAFAFAPRMKTALALLALGSVVLALLYGYVLPFGYPKMTGLTFEQVPVRATTRLLRTLVDIAAVGGVGAGLWYLLGRFGGKPFVIGLALANLSLVAAAALGVSRDSVGGKGGSQDDAALEAQPIRLSPNQPNTLVIFLDRFMGGYVEGILAADPAMRSRLDGFTWYPRTVSAGENSIAGVHPMLGGYDYLPVEMNARRKPLRDLSVEAFSILPYNFSRKDHRVNVVEPGGLGFTMEGDCSYLSMPGVYCSHIPPALVRREAQRLGFPLPELSRASYADLLVLLGSMRTAPYGLKGVLLKKGPWRPFLDHSAGTTFRVWAELQSFDELTNVRAEEPNFNVVTNILPHEPYFLGEDCMPRSERLELPEAEIVRRGEVSLFALQHANAARCTLEIVAGYLDFLKRAGVYDNTEIVIVSDHGIVGPVIDRSSRAVAGGTWDNKYVRTRSVLLVKKIGAHGEVRTDETFTPNAEVPRIVCERIGGCVNPYLGGRPITAQGRDDPFFVSLVPWQFSRQKPDAFVIHTQLVLQNKDPYDARNWKVVR